MSEAPCPVAFEPIFKRKPWGSRSLARLFDKRLPADDPIGESWEVSDLPGAESRVAGGPHAGRTLGELVESWGYDLLGSAPKVDGRFPLLIKFLDAAENLSVQVHPKPASDDPVGWRPGIKHEAWYVVDALPGAKLYIGLRPSVDADQMASAANTPRVADLLQARDAIPGSFFYLPSGTPHALGAGVIVAEVQTPSDVTYRLYDWDRLGLDGAPRELHIEQGLANVRYDVGDSEIMPSSRGDGACRALVRCPRFEIDHLTSAKAERTPIESARMRILIVLRGTGAIVEEHARLAFSGGDVLLIPACGPRRMIESTVDCEWLEVRVPDATAGR